MNVKEQIRNNGNVYDIENVYFNSDNRMTICFCEYENQRISKFINDIKTGNDKIIELLTRSGDVYAEYTGYSSLVDYDLSRFIVIVDVKEKQETPSPEYIPSIEYVREEKIKELSQTCNSLIEYGVDVEIDGAVEHFSYKTEDQNNIKDAFDLAFRTNLSVPYHADNQSCKLYTPNQMAQIFIAEKSNLTHHTTYFNQMKMYIMSLNDRNSILGIKYGDPLTGQYLDDYNNMMEAAMNIIYALLNGYNVEGGESDV